MNRSELEALAGIVAAMIAQRTPNTVAREGVIAAGSYNPTDGTVQVIFGDTAAIIGDDGDAGVPVTRLPLATTQIGDQAAPRGGERVVIIPTQSGYLALMHTDEDDSPNAPQGERWICHRNAAGEIDAYVKLTNSGATTGDELGGILILAGSQFQVSAGSLALILDNATELLKLGTTTALAGVVRKPDLQQAINELAAIVQGGSGVTPPIVNASTTVQASA